MARRSRARSEEGKSPPQPSQLGCELSAASCGALVLRTVFAGQVIEGDRFGPVGMRLRLVLGSSYGRSGTRTRIQGPEVAGKGSRSPRRAPNRQLGSRRGSPQRGPLAQGGGAQVARAAERYGSWDPREGRLQ